MNHERSSRNLGFDRFSGLYLMALFVVVFGIWTPDLFLTLSTLHFVTAQQAVVGMLALAVLVPMATGAFDLSVGANVNLSAVLVAILQTRYEYPMWWSVIIAIAAGCLIGVMNGFVVVKLRVNSFIATLGTATLIGAVQTIITDGSQPFPPVAKAWSQLTQREVAGFQIVVLYLLLLALVIWWFLERTPAGRYMYAIGSNAEAARLSGLAVGKWTWTSLTISGAICGLAGIMYASLSGPSLTFGASLLLPAFAAVFLGSTQLKPGRFNVWGTLLAIYVLAVGVQGLQFVTSVQWLSSMFNGIALILAVAFAGERQRASAKRRRTFRDSQRTSGGPIEPDKEREAPELVPDST
jgi:ribose transport system permease protein